MYACMQQCNSLLKIIMYIIIIICTPLKYLIPENLKANKVYEQLYRYTVAPHNTYHTQRGTDRWCAMVGQTRHANSGDLSAAVTVCT